MNCWNIRKDGHLILRPNVRPLGVYISFDPAKRQFFRHNVYPLETSDAWLPYPADQIDPEAVAEAIAFSITRAAGERPFLFTEPEP